MKLLHRVRDRVGRISRFLAPSEAAWRGAAYGVWLVAIVLVAGVVVSEVFRRFSFGKLLAFVIAFGGLLLIGGAIRLALRILVSIAPAYRGPLLLLAPIMVMLMLPAASPRGTAIILVTLLLGLALVGGALAVLREPGRKRERRWLPWMALGVGVAILVTGLFVLFGPKAPQNPALAGFELEDRTLDLEDPSAPGDYDVITLTYGSGEDPRRPEYGAEVDLVSRTVDGSKLIDRWEGLGGWVRTRYWGVTPESLPLQGRVWAPAGEGPFPLVLIVHGNHDMEDVSDPGYAYLGELFASRGFLFVSVDENFLNSSFADLVRPFKPGLEEENDARGWLLLEHLRLWRDWNGTPGHRFEGKVDMDRVALIGHSRGGEAVATAGVFNRLDHYPDDATLAFDFDFGLRGIIAIAPVDGQYQPRDRGNPLRDVDYFVIHGSMDGDVQSFMGTSVYSRARFSGEAFGFKASLYVVGANHGQFNTGWGRCDTGGFWCWALDRRPIISGEDQRRIAKVYFSAFLEAVLEDNRAYLPIFGDARRAARWLPDTFYVTNYADTEQVTIADFEEDLDPGTASLAGSIIEGRYLTRWSESWVKLKWRPLESDVALLSWDERVHPEPATYTVTLPPDVTLEPDDSLVFALAASEEKTLPKGWQDEHPENETEVDGDGDDVADRDDEPSPLDWTVILTDRKGESASLPLSRDLPLYPPIRSKPRLTRWMSAAKPSELVFRRYCFPFADFAAVNAGLDVTGLAEIRFVFDLSARGSIAVDDIAFVGQSGHLAVARRRPPETKTAVPSHLLR